MCQEHKRIFTKRNSDLRRAFPVVRWELDYAFTGEGQGVGCTGVWYQVGVDERREHGPCAEGGDSFSGGDRPDRDIVAP